MISSKQNRPMREVMLESFCDLLDLLEFNDSVTHVNMNVKVGEGINAKTYGIDARLPEKDITIKSPNNDEDRKAPHKAGATAHVGCFDPDRDAIGI